ncbi:AidA/PixA family protein [Xenorhabdus koppenhoeferi]|uniref:Inclusion body protein n=1 Tax=Xenorhabdus koppenhoeferi TaxID=351659 RepID=A0A1I7GWL9_9GAMM|nr:AidA/PixA family protein [Xenorhabdus koppenhoeferi]SFU52822.1 Inclusion body protein [Xenorhabdus koppenhoeferi]
MSGSSQKIIDILITIQADDLVKRYGNRLSIHPDSPTPINDYNEYFHLFTEKNNVYLHQGSGDLIVSANKGDVLRWRDTTLTKNSIYSTALVKFEAFPPRNIHNEDLIHEHLSPMTVKHFYDYIMDVETAKPLEVIPQQVKSYYWESTVQKMPFLGTSVTLSYSLVFGIYKDGKLLGYVMMDPGIRLDNSN